MTALKVAPGLALPLDLAGEATAILAKRGAGKSNTAKVVVEEILDTGLVQVIALDPVGHWWSLRAGANGKPRGGYEVAVFGGMHGDLPLEATAGKLLAQTAVESGQSIVLDVSGLDSNGAMQRFAYEFAEELYKLKQGTPTPLLLVLEEADEFAPQTTSGPNVARMVGAFARLMKRGRGRGIGMLVISQRSAALSKNVLDQADTLIVMRTVGPRDRAAIEGWIKHQSAAGADEVLPSLPSLATGEAWVWNPERDLLRRVKIRKARTFDSTQSSRPGEAAVSAEVKPIDVEQLGYAIAATVERAKENDPAALRKRITALERELADRPTGMVTETIEVQVPVEVPVLDDELVSRLEAEVEDLLQITEVIAPLRAVVDQIQSSLASAKGAVAAPPPRRVAPEPPQRRPAAPERPARDVPDGDVHLKAGARRILETFARHYPMRMTKAQLGTLAKFKVSGGTFTTYWSTLKRAGYVEEQGGECWITDVGLAQVGHVAREPMTTDELLEQWRSALKAGARAMLDALVAVHPSELTKDQLADRVQMTASGGTFTTYLSTLRRNGLVDVDGQMVRASDTLFIGADA